MLVSFRLHLHFHNLTESQLTCISYTNETVSHRTIFVNKLIVLILSNTNKTSVKSRQNDFSAFRCSVILYKLIVYSENGITQRN